MAATVKRSESGLHEKQHDKTQMQCKNWKKGHSQVLRTTKHSQTPALRKGRKLAGAEKRKVFKNSQITPLATMQMDNASPGKERFLAFSQ